MRAPHVVLATGPFTRPRVLAAADGLSPQVHQLHSSDYCSPADVPPGDVLVVGGGNSAAQLAVELSATHRVTVASARPPWDLPTSVLGVDLYWWLRLTGVVAADGDTVRLADGTAHRVSSVLWCTGLRPDTAWLDVPGAVDADGTALHEAGASPGSTTTPASWRPGSAPRPDRAAAPGCAERLPQVLTDGIIAAWSRRPGPRLGTRSGQDADADGTAGAARWCSPPHHCRGGTP